jgi:hypothetical protein
MKSEFIFDLIKNKRRFLVFFFFIASFSLSSCGVWVGSPTEDTPPEDGGKQRPSSGLSVYIGSDDFPSPEFGPGGDTGDSSGNGPIKSGVFSVTKGKPSATLCSGTIRSYTSKEAKLLSLSYTELDKSVQNVNYAVSFGGANSKASGELKLTNLGTYTISVTFSKRGADQICQISLEYLKDLGDESYELEFRL